MTLLSTVKSFTIGALVGLAVGTVALIIACVICVVLAFQTGDHAALPGVFDAWLAEVDGIPQIRFVPNLGGMVIALAVWAAICGVIGTQLRRRGNRPAPDLAVRP